MGSATAAGKRDSGLREKTDQFLKAEATAKALVDKLKALESQAKSYSAARVDLNAACAALGNLSKGLESATEGIREYIGKVDEIDTAAILQHIDDAGRMVQEPVSHHLESLAELKHALEQVLDALSSKISIAEDSQRATKSIGKDIKLVQGTASSISSEIGAVKQQLEQSAHCVEALKESISSVSRELDGRLTSRFDEMLLRLNAQDEKLSLLQAKVDQNATRTDSAVRQTIASQIQAANKLTWIAIGLSGVTLVVAVILLLMR